MLSGAGAHRSTGTSSVGAAAGAAQAYMAAGVPSVDTWPDLSADEREYREQMLDDIVRRVQAEGHRRAVPSPDRGRQFLPFAALKE